MDDAIRKLVLGEAIMDELKAIQGCVKDVPSIRSDLNQVHIKVDQVNNRLQVLEKVVRDQELDIKHLKINIS
ncbi:hypothetical protein DYH10_01645 [Candidatus Saccharibacteria bacterium CPR2]|nr:hypothetical protein [Candidatus Saccharibacteria bacterium CPR2]